MEFQEQIIRKIINYRYNETESRLNLWYQSFHWTAVLMSRNWQKLQSLDLPDCSISDDSFQIFLDLNWPKLAKLNLRNNKLTVQSIRQLCSKKLPKIDTLQLNLNNIEDEGFILIIKTFQKKLLLLNLMNCSITETGISFMPGMQLDNLKQLNMNGNMIGNTGLKWFVKANLINFQKLGLGNCLIGVEGILHFTKGKWPNLKAISFSQFYDQKNENFIALGWLHIHLNLWKITNELIIKEDSAISLMSFVLIESEDIKFQRYGINIKNPDLFNSIYKILLDRDIIDSL